MPGYEIFDEAERREVLQVMETGILMDHSILKYDGRQISGNEIISRVRNEVL